MTLLRRHFIAVGVPPQPPRYDYDCPEPLIKNRKRNTEVLDRKLDATPESVTFRALLADSEDVREIMDNIQVIDEVAHALRRAGLAVCLTANSQKLRGSLTFSAVFVSGNGPEALDRGDC